MPRLANNCTIPLSLARISSFGRRSLVHAGAVDPQGGARVLWGSKPQASRRWALGEAKEAPNQLQCRMGLIDTEGWTSPKTEPEGRRALWAGGAHPVPEFFRLLYRLSPDSEDPSPAFPTGFGTRDGGDKVSRASFLFASELFPFFWHAFPQPF